MVLFYLVRYFTSNYQALDFGARLNKATARMCLDVCLTSLCVVIAGSGNQQVMNLIQKVLSLSDTIYGNYMAAHMALGFLFLAGGTATFSNSTDAIAFLLCSLYPRYPLDSPDNNTHLQALRHFWVLAVEHRLLITKDVDTGEACCVPLKISLKEQSDVEIDASTSVPFVAPVFLPPLEFVEEIMIDVPRYWKRRITAYELQTAEYRKYEGFVIWVKRKTGHLTYLQVHSFI